MANGFFITSLPVSANLLNEDTPQPHDVRHLYRKQLGPTGAYEPVVAVMAYGQEWVYKRMTFADYQFFLDRLDPVRPVQYIMTQEPRHNVWYACYAIMHWPQAGAVKVWGLENCVVRFSFLKLLQ